MRAPYYALLLLSITVQQMRSFDLEDKRSVLEWVRTRLSRLRERISSGVNLQELRSLKSYLVGVSGEEAAQLEREIEELLGESDGLDVLNLDVNEENIKKPTDEKSDLDGLNFNLNNDKVAQKTKGEIVHDESPVGYASPDACGQTETKIFLERYTVSPAVMLVTDVEWEATETTTHIVTASQIHFETFSQNEIYTIRVTPVLTKTVSVLVDDLRTVETTIPEVRWKTQTVHISDTEREIHYVYATLETTSPAFVTSVSSVYETIVERVTVTEPYRSTMTLTSVDYVRIPVTVTEDQNRRPIKQIVGKTEFVKVMKTLTETVRSTSTLTTTCAKFIDKMKKFKIFG